MITKKLFFVMCLIIIVVFYSGCSVLESSKIDSSIQTNTISTTSKQDTASTTITTFTTSTTETAESNATEYSTDYVEPTSEKVIETTEIEKSTQTTEAPKPTTPKKNIDSVVIGNYNGNPVEWLVLTSKNNSTLLISKYILDYKKFRDSTIAESTNWERSTIRQWLNEDFYNSTFSEEERSYIQISTVQDFMEDHKLGEKTEDKVFLLSHDDAWTFFKDDNARKASSTSYAKSQYKYSNDSWWLIDSYSSELYKYVVNNKGKCENYPRVNETNGVRPAMWVNNELIK